MEQDFKFRLGKILEIKLKKESEHMIFHTKIINEKMAIEKDIQNLESQYEKYSTLQYLEEDSLKRKIVYNYTNSLFQTIQIKKDELEEVEARYQESLNKLMILQSERKALEKLKEKQYQLFLDELELEEETLNDEFSTQAYFRLLEN